ncbi:peptidoglycan editing factor PgeF [Allobacillus sp. GCM10007491]|uniref:Purine nucleoside phosphorylase n=1 Tax=Allobacillus saliphilus TaxID=2912308 RepID=A0A941CS59_9BACI|nr:peptidoglycan editing factor PgeF [Allobacillus saliphilus]
MKDVFNYDESTAMLLIKEWEKYGVIAGFTTKNNGVSKPPFEGLNLGLHVNDHREDVMENRQIITNALNKDLIQWRCINQIHGDRIVDLTDRQMDDKQLQHDKPLLDADGMFSNDSNDFLVTYYADCVPLYVIDSKNHYFGMAHAGWKGTVKGIGKKLVETFQQKGSKLSDMHVAIGPSISQTHYEVNDAVAEQIPKEHAQILVATKPGHYLLDLKTLNERIFVEAGIRPDQILKTNYCTFEQEDLFYSYRRDQGKTGRMAAFLGVL